MEFTVYCRFFKPRKIINNIKPQGSVKLYDPLRKRAILIFLCKSTAINHMGTTVKKRSVSDYIYYFIMEEFLLVAFVTFSIPIVALFEFHQTSKGRFFNELRVSLKNLFPSLVKYIQKQIFRNTVSNTASNYGRNGCVSRDECTTKPF